MKYDDFLTKGFLSCRIHSRSFFLFALLRVQFYKQKPQQYKEVKERKFLKPNLFQKGCMWLITLLYANIPTRDPRMATWIC